MPLTVRSLYKGYPDGWATFDAHVRKRGPRAFGFRTTAAKVNRFAARYRAAKCFREASFDVLTAETAQGYSALCKLLLAYSAFEHFLDAIPTDLRAAASMLNESETVKVLKKLRLLDQGNTLFTFLRPHLRTTYQRQIDIHLAGRCCNPFYLAASIRHLFAHGLLTPNPGRGIIGSVATVSEYLSRVLISVMNREFEGRIKEFRNQAASPVAMVLNKGVQKKGNSRA